MFLYNCTCVTVIYSSEIVCSPIITSSYNIFTHTKKKSLAMIKEDVKLTVLHYYVKQTKNMVYIGTSAMSFCSIIIFYQT